MDEPSISRIFRYVPNQIHLVGFPDSPVLNDLSGSLGREVSLKRHQPRFCDSRRVLPLVPSFPNQYAKDRQRFFQRLPHRRIAKNIFEREFPKSIEARCSVEDFLNYCGKVYATIEGARGSLQGFGHLPEARAVFRRLRDFDGELGDSLRALEEIKGANKFAIDAKTDVIVPIDEMPTASQHPRYRANMNRQEWGRREDGFRDIRVKMAKAVLRIIEQGKEDFKGRIRNFARAELEYNPDRDNVRTNFERFAVPVRLHHKYHELMEDSEEGKAESDEWVDSEEMRELPGHTYPKFAEHYDIRGLFPPSLLGEGYNPEIVPIDFRTRRGEKKFLIAGLHSGGKSFFLENLVLTSILAQLGVSMFADSVVVPKSNHLFYYRNPDNSKTGAGKLEKEFGDLVRIAEEAKKGDEVFVDEFLDSGSEAADWIGADLLDRLGNSEANVFISTHKSPDYHALEKKGWTIMTPGHKRVKGKVVPTRRLARGHPDRAANMDYTRDQYEKLLKKDRRI